MLPPLVLAYHVLGWVPRELDPSNLVFHPLHLRDQLIRLRRRGYAFAFVSELVDRLVAGRPIHGICAITLDDGTLDHLTLLPQVLEAVGARATLYVCPGLLGTPHPNIDRAAAVRLMDEAELRAAAALPCLEIGSHSNTHPDLSAATYEEALLEMRSSKDALETILEREVVSFAYPECAYSAACPAAAQQAGYKSAATCAPRGGWRPYELVREPISARDGPLARELKLRRLYYPAWVSPPGRAARRALRPFRHRRVSVQTPNLSI